MKNLHIALSEDLVQRLDRLGERLDETRVGMVREAVVEYVTRRERELMAQEMARYAEEMGGDSRALVAWSEAEVDRMLRESTEW